MLKRTAIGLVLVALAGSIGYWLSPSSRSPSDQYFDRQTLGAQSIVQLDSLSSLQETSTPETTHTFIRRQLNRQVSIPTLEGYSLAGITIEDIVEGARVPVLIYEKSNTTVTVYVYNYALLDDHPDKLHLSRQLLKQLERENRFVSEQHEDHYIVFWRNRDDIYAAVSRENPDSLLRRIRP
jgi:hypothetical protein